ncbi:hypothetical protein MNB_SV-13-41 [hydrothermal vent metagenome]|uniref:Uncharacterized protein n=1 Tax=hydrothermal vent metagenome TaxID=652676 RepID=A0A1W1D013_9ZZZZ
MPIPFILGGIALAAAGYGAKKGYDAYEDYDTADNYNQKAEDLGKLKVSIYEESLADFVDIFSEIKNIDFEDKLDIGTDVNIDYSSMLQIKNSVIEINELIGGGLAAAGGGALAGFGALGGVGMLASASTGTAIASLSGVAATNATLAWLGGGSLATGGFGMAGGMAVLGGIVAGPVLAIGGALIASKAEEAKYNAYANFDKAKVDSEEMNVAKEVLDGITLRVEEFITLLEPIKNIFEEYIDKMENIVDKSNDYSQYSENDKKTIMVTASIAQTIKNVCDAPIIDEEGAVTRKSKRVLKKASKFIEQLEAV